MSNLKTQHQSPLASFHMPLRLVDDRPLSDTSPDSPELGSDLQEFNVRLANSASQREAATLLLKKMYSWRGYSVEDHPDVTPTIIMLAAESIGSTVATMTLCMDGPMGLPADGTFGAELDVLRAQNRRLTEPSRLAIDKSTPNRVFAALIHIAYLYAHKIHGYSDFIIEVNPRHAVFYKRMLGFRELAEERLCSRVGAPAVLLRLDFAYMQEQIARFGGLFEKAPGTRSFYPFFFSQKDEAGIQHRLLTGQT